MKKSTLIFLTVATLALGSLVGGALGQEPPANPVDQLVAEQPQRSGKSLEFRYLEPGDEEVQFSETGRALPVALGENFIGRDEVIKSDTVIIQIEAEGETEYKALMQQGDTVVYTWKTDGAEVFYDFHAHDNAFGKKFFTRYSKGDASTDSGAIVAAYSGEHGWYLRNRTNKPVEITLKVSGFYDRIVKIDL